MKNIVSLALLSAVVSLTVPVYAQAPRPGDATDRNELQGGSGGSGFGRESGSGFGSRRQMYGKRGGGGAGGGGGRMGAMDGLLTDAQRTQVQALKEANRAKTKPLMEQMKALRQSGGGQDEKSKAQFQALRQQMQTERKATHEKIMSLLTPDQKAKLAAQAGQGGGRQFGGQGGAGGRGGRGGAGGFGGGAGQPGQPGHLGQPGGQGGAGDFGAPGGELDD